MLTMRALVAGVVAAVLVGLPAVQVDGSVRSDHGCGTEIRLRDTWESDWVSSERTERTENPYLRFADTRELAGPNTFGEAYGSLASGKLGVTAVAREHFYAVPTAMASVYMWDTLYIRNQTPDLKWQAFNFVLTGEGSGFHYGDWSVSIDGSKVFRQLHQRSYFKEVPLVPGLNIITIDLTLAVNAMAPGVANFGNTLSISMPQLEAVEYGSRSGLFLTAVPEPAAGLVVVGLAMAMMRRRRT
jgi:hypothetical protein